MDATIDPVEKLRDDIDALRNMIDDALDKGEDEAILRSYALLLRDRKRRLAQLEQAEINRQIFRLA